MLECNKMQKFPPRREFKMGVFKLDNNKVLCLKHFIEQKEKTLINPYEAYFLS